MSVTTNQSRQLAGLLGALADATRRGLFEWLAQGPCSVGELTKRATVSRSAVSQHLKVLKDAALVQETRKGQQHIYAVSANARALLLQLSGYALDLGNQASASTHAAPPAPATETPGHAAAAADNVSWGALSDEVEPRAVGLVARVYILGERMQRLFIQTAAKHRLNVGEAMMLGTLKRLGSETACTPTQLGELSLISLPGIAKRLNHLEALGLVERLVDARDRRSVRVRLTASGREVFRAISQEQFGCNYTAFHRLSNEQQGQLDGTVRFLLESLPEPT